MAQTKLNNILTSVSNQIGDPALETYTQTEVLSAVNMARGKIYDDHLLRICGAESMAKGDIGVFAEVYPEWVFENALYISTITGATTLTITTKKPHRLISGQLITITGVTGYGTNPNGDYAVLSSGLTENVFQITHTVVSGAYSSGGKIVVRLSSNEIIKPIDCRMILSGLLNSSSPAVTNGIVKRLSAETYHEAKYNTYSPFAAAADALKMYQKSDTIELIGSEATYVGNLQLLYLAGPVEAVVSAGYNDIVDRSDWMNDIIDIACEILMSYELE